MGSSKGKKGNVSKAEVEVTSTEEEPTVASVTVEAEAPPAPEKEAPRTFKFRGKECKIVRSTRDNLTGAEYDYVEYEVGIRQKDGKGLKRVTLQRRFRRPGTGSFNLNRETEI